MMRKTSDEKSFSFFPEKNMKLVIALQIVKLLLLAGVNWLLMTGLNKASEFLAHLVPSNEAWTLVVMVIPLSVFGVYASLLSSNYNQNKDLVICGKFYGEIRKISFSDITFIATFRDSAVIMAVLLVCYFARLEYPMLIGTALILSVDLFALTINELDECKKSKLDLYEAQFATRFKKVAEVFFPATKLAEIEKMVLVDNWEAIKEILLSKHEFLGETLGQLKYETNAMSEPLSKEVWLKLVNTFSLPLSRIENSIFYKEFLFEIIGFSRKKRETGDSRFADEILLCVGERWVKNTVDYFKRMTRAIQKQSKRARRKSGKIVNFMEEVQRHRISFRAFFAIEKDVLQALMELEDITQFKERKQQLLYDINNIHEQMERVSNQYDSFFDSMKKRMAIS